MVMTLRKEIIALLENEQLTAREISQAVHITVKEVYGHLEHISRTRRGAFGMQPAQCLACGFVFAKRTKVTSPSRCPICKSEHIQDPYFFCKG